MPDPDLIASVEFELLENGKLIFSRVIYRKDNIMAAKTVAESDDVYRLELGGITLRKNGRIMHQAKGFVWDDMDYPGMQLLQNTLYQSVLALGNAKAEATS